MIKKNVMSGKRKTAVAKAYIGEGNGKVVINNVPYQTLNFFDRLKIEEPLKIAENILGHKKFDINVKIIGGGNKGRVEAARLAIARSIVSFTKNKDVEKAFLEYDRGLLIADVRRKEAYKPGDSKARRKRQKSYR